VKGLYFNIYVVLIAVFIDAILKINKNPITQLLTLISTCHIIFINNVATCFGQC